MTSRVQKLANEVLDALGSCGLSLATAESCTGGGIGQALTAVPGSSQIYRGGVISYTNGVKTGLLGVPEQLLRELGAVSAPVAEAMARGARRACQADVAVAVTGLAGPGGDEFGNPVGTVWLACASQDRVCSICCHFAGAREAVREQARCRALELILEAGGLG